MSIPGWLLLLFGLYLLLTGQAGPFVALATTNASSATLSTTSGGLTGLTGLTGLSGYGL